MRYLTIPMGTGALGCRRELVQFGSGSRGLCFAIGCLLVLLPMNPHTAPVITKPRKEKGKGKAKESTLPCGLGQQLCSRGEGFLLSYHRGGKNSHTKLVPSLVLWLVVSMELRHYIQWETDVA